MPRLKSALIAVSNTDPELQVPTAVRTKVPAPASVGRAFPYEQAPISF